MIYMNKNWRVNKKMISRTNIIDEYIDVIDKTSFYSYKLLLCLINLDDVAWDFAIIQSSYLNISDEIITCKKFPDTTFKNALEGFIYMPLILRKTENKESFLYFLM